MNDPCPCGSGQPSAACCDPYLAGERQPPTAEALMRSRYTAYVRADVDYILRTHEPIEGEEVDREATLRWAKESQWKGLEIVSASEDGDTGQVEFKARYVANDAELVHHERSNFRRKDGMWRYVDGTPVKPVPIRAEAKAGRNDPCPCGSGKKFKRCHG
jgi:SEC-C motif domain protein